MTDGLCGFCTLIRLARNRSVHIFASIPYRPGKTLLAFLAAVLFRQTIFIIAERPNQLDSHGERIKFLRDRILCAAFGRFVSVFLAIGELAVDYYVRVGFPRRKIYSFAYFPNVMHPLEPSDELTDGESFVVLFVGNMAAHKGPDLAIKALASLPAPRPVLNMAGSGVMEQELRQLARSLEVTDDVHFLGVVRHDRVPGLIREADVVLVPSRYDGWGAVTNEALLSGTPVIVSDACGSMDLIDSFAVGEVVPAGDAFALAEAIGRRLCMGPSPPEDRARLRATAQVMVSPESGAAYLQEIISWLERGADLPPPRPPWMDVAID